MNGESKGAPIACGRVASHRRLLIVLWLVNGVLHVILSFPFLAFWLPGANVLLMNLSAGNLMRLQPPLTTAQWAFVAANTAWTVSCVVVAWGLFDRTRWARAYTIVVSAIWMLDFPLGTALGIYTLWVLLPETSEAEYRQLAMQ